MTDPQAAEARAREFLAIGDVNPDSFAAAMSMPRQIAADVIALSVRLAQAEQERDELASEDKNLRWWSRANQAEERAERAEARLREYEEALRIAQDALEFVSDYKTLDDIAAVLAASGGREAPDTKETP